MVLDDWQKQLILRLYARRPDGRRRYRLALIGIPRKNGKSGLGSGLALNELLFQGQGAQVFSAAAEKEQAKIVFNDVKAMINRSEDLTEICKPMRDVIDVPTSGSTYRALSAEAYSKEGLNISAAIVDELHAHPTPDLWNVLTLGTGAREEPLIIAITTAGTITDSTGEESTCYRLYQYGIDVALGNIEDPSFFFCWWGAKDDDDPSDPEVWQRANPGYGSILNPEDIAEAFKRTPINEFKTKRLNLWVTSTESFLPPGKWDACAQPERVVDGSTKVVLGFDGSYAHDCTALVGCTVEENPHIFTVGLWQRPFDADASWHVPIADVENAIRAACQRYNVVEIAVDPWGFERSFEILLEERLPVVAFPQQNAERMVKATERFYEAVVNGLLTHDDNEDLAKHVGNTRTRVVSGGVRVTKATKKSPLKIDLAVASIMAFGTAANMKAPPRSRIINLAGLLANDGSGER